MTHFLNDFDSKHITDTEFAAPSIDSGFEIRANFIFPRLIFIGLFSNWLFNFDFNYDQI